MPDLSFLGNPWWEVYRVKFLEISEKGSSHRLFRIELSEDGSSWADLIILDLNREEPRKLEHVNSNGPRIVRVRLNGGMILVRKSTSIPVSPCLFENYCHPEKGQLIIFAVI